MAVCLGLKKKCFYLPLLPEFVDCVSHDWEGSRLSKCHCLGKMSILIFFPTQNCWTVLMATEKILTYTTLSAFFLPGGNRHACLGGEVALIPEGGDPGVTMAHDTVTCNMFARAREGSPYHLFSSSCWVVGTWRMFMSCLGFCLHLKACSWRL